MSKIKTQNGNPAMYVERGEVELCVILDGLPCVDQSDPQGDWEFQDISAVVCEGPQNGTVIELTLPEKERAEEILLEWFRERREQP